MSFRVTTTAYCLRPRHRKRNEGYVRPHPYSETVTKRDVLQKGEEDGWMNLYNLKIWDLWERAANTHEAQYLDAKQ